jgi:hypothetical protein
MSGDNFSLGNDLVSSLAGQSPLEATLSDESGLQALLNALSKTNAGSKGASLDSSQIHPAYTAPYSPLQSVQTDFGGSSSSGSSGSTNKASTAVSGANSSSSSDRDPLTGLSKTDATASVGSLGTDALINQNSKNIAQVEQSATAVQHTNSITVALANDTAPSGTTNTDTITSDPTITGTLYKPSPGVRLWGRFDNQPTSARFEITSELKADGSFRLSPARLAQINRGPLSEGRRVLRLTVTAANPQTILSGIHYYFTLDRRAPNRPVNLDLTNASDSGRSNQDNITNQTTPLIRGNAESGAIVQMFDGSKRVGQATARNSGWKITTTPLAEGAHSLRVRAIDAAGNISQVSKPLVIGVDSIAPQVNVSQDLNNASLTYGDRLKGTVNGTGSGVVGLSYRWDNQPETKVQLKNNSFDQEFDFQGLTNGVHTLVLSEVDLAGNLNTVRYQVTTVLDTTGPAITAQLTNDTAANNTSNSDGITSDPSIQGTIADASQIVQFKAGFDEIAEANYTDVLADLSGTGSFSFDTTRIKQLYGGMLPDGDHTLHLIATDLRGNSTKFDIAFTLDTTLPTQPGFSLGAGFDSAPVGDSRTRFEVVTLNGQTETNATVRLLNTDLTATADALGHFELTNVRLVLGANSLTVEAIDAAGNRSLITQTMTRLASDGSDTVLDWNATGLQAVRYDRSAPPIAAYNMALVHTAIYDAVNAIERTHQVYHVDTQGSTVSEGVRPQLDLGSKRC